MNKEQKLLAYQAIAENVKDTTARQIVRYVLECELFNQDTVSPTNVYLSEKYKWSIETTKVAISLAKKSQFITTTGYGKSRCLEFNVSFLKGKMAEIYQKKIKPKLDFSDVVPNTLPNTLPNTFSNKKTLLEPQTAVFEGDNNNNSNNNNINPPQTKVCEWTLEKYLSLLRTDPNRHIRIIGYYIKEANLKIPSKLVAERILKRCLRSARELQEYQDEDIKRAFETVKRTYPDWTLETIIKTLPKI